MCNGDLRREALGPALGLSCRLTARRATKPVAGSRVVGDFRDLSGTIAVTCVREESGTERFSF
jgi:hypothetical protein